MATDDGDMIDAGYAALEPRDDDDDNVRAGILWLVEAIVEAVRASILAPRSQAKGKRR